MVSQLSSVPVAPEEVDVRVITYTPSVTDSTALSLDRLAPHTDGAFLDQPPPRFALSCIRTDDRGEGASTFIPVDVIVDSAPGWVVESLARASFRFLKTYDGDLTDSYVGPVLTTDHDGARRIRWRADHLYRPEPGATLDGTRAAEAVPHGCTSCGDLRAVRATSCRPAASLWLIPNGRVVHGRTALS